MRQVHMALLLQPVVVFNEELCTCSSQGEKVRS